MQLSALATSIILIDMSKRLTINNLFSRFGKPKEVFITSNASKVPKIPGVTPITGKGPSEDLVGSCSSGSEKTH